MITTYYNHKPLAFGQPIFRQTMDPVWRATKGLLNDSQT
jgi:hypothetical protein